ncbi:MAG: hypothetical protein IKZ45_06135 [Fibrobacter sp.]|nr:hypothetical protein [Fibrobacter sp.]
MDLREKPGKVQNFLELMLRTRLIAVVVMVVVTVTVIAKAWNGVVGLPIAASEGLGMWLAGIENVQSIWTSSQYLAVAALACLVMFFVFGGVRAGVASLVSTALLGGALLVMGGSEDLALPMYGILALVSLLMLLFAKLSVSCVLFPFALAWLFLSAALSAIPWPAEEPMNLVWGVYSAFGFACSMAFALVAGKHLGMGAPQNGAIVKAARQMFAPVVIGALLLEAAVTVDMLGKANIIYGILRYLVFVAWFFVFVIPVSSFAPWGRLRSGSRRVQMKDKKKKK